MSSTNSFVNYKTAVRDEFIPFFMSTSTDIFDYTSLTESFILPLNEL